MRRIDFYSEYYDRTDQDFSEKFLWGKKEREEAWRKRQWRHVSKFERKLVIITQYLILLLCWIPLCLDRSGWVAVPIALLAFSSLSFASNFSFVKIELLYSVYRKDNAYCAVLYDIFLGKFTCFLNDLRRATKKETVGYVHKSSRLFCDKYFAMCRNKSNQVLLAFQRNKVTVTVNKKVTVINDMTLTKEELLQQIATAINEGL